MIRPRVLIFSLAYFPFVGGAEVALKELTDRLSDFDFEMLTVNLDGQQAAEEKIGNVLIRRLAPSTMLGVNKYLFPLIAYREAKRLHQAKPYDLVWAMMANQAGMAAARFKKDFPKVPFLITLQEGDDFASLAYRARLWLVRLAGVFKKPDHVQVISNYLKQWARDMGATCPVTVIPNGVDLKKFEIRNSKFETNSNDQSKEKFKTIITTSRLVKKNGVDTLIESLTFLPENIKLQILGTGPEEASLKVLVNRLKLAPRVSFFGQVDNSQVGQYLAQADVFARPSRSEGLGISFLEAMAAGLPTIGTPVGGIPDFLYGEQGRTIEQGQTGWLCRVNDPQSLADKIKFILDPANREQISIVTQNAVKLINENYNWDNLARKFGEILRNL